MVGGGGGVRKYHILVKRKSKGDFSCVRFLCCVDGKLRA